MHILNHIAHFSRTFGVFKLSFLIAKQKLCIVNGISNAKQTQKK